MTLVMPVNYSTFQSLAHTTACAKTVSKCTMQVRIPPTEKRAQTLSEASSSSCSVGGDGGALPSALLTAASFSASLCSRALWPLSLQGMDNSPIKCDGRLKTISPDSLGGSSSIEHRANQWVEIMFVMVLKG